MKKNAWIFHYCKVSFLLFQLFLYDKLAFKYLLVSIPVYN
jgi:hypothetical protein